MGLLVEMKYSSSGTICLESELLRTMRSASQARKKVSDIFQLLQDSLFRYLVRILDDRAEAEDVLQEAFLRLYQCLQRGRLIEDVRPWLFRVAHNLAVDRFRKKNPTDLVDDDTWRLIRDRESDPSPNAEQKLLEQEKRQRIEIAFTRLAPRERYCLELRAEGLCYREIAEVLGIRTPTLVSLLGRVTTKMASEIYDENMA
ncbi:MAG: RNA polymerase sigma factor [Acidobacteriota bacterium]